MQQGKHRVWKAWLLTALLVLPVAVRAIHVFEEAHAYSGESRSHHHHDCNSCVLCQFTLSAFTGTESIVCDFVNRASDPQPIVLSFCVPYISPLPANTLRGPPANPDTLC